MKGKRESLKPSKNCGSPKKGAGIAAKSSMENGIILTCQPYRP